MLNAQLRQAQSQFDTARIDAKRCASLLDKHQIRAPFDGVVIDRSAQPGEMVSPMSAGGYTRTGICTSSTWIRSRSRSMSARPSSAASSPEAP